MPAPIDMIGKTFNKLTVISEVSPTRYKTQSVRRFLFRCECGVSKEIDGHVVRSGSVVSCGCYRDEGQSNFRHGHSRDRSPEYLCWKHIIQRCENKNVKRYENYGGRGISVCKKWRESFPSFLADVGQKPSPKHSIDRYPDNDGNYEPGNVRWATAAEQRLNQRKRRFWKKPAASLEN